jgi:putative CRISPR-associated protein (TIGR02619 family)
MKRGAHRRCIISTIGTSLLTNGAQPETVTLLRATANFALKDYSPEQLCKVDEREQEVRRQLEASSKGDVRRKSAELNGILALAESDTEDIHYLLYTDTYQGQQAMVIVWDWLISNGHQTVVPQRMDGLNTASQEEFASGIDSLLYWCHQTVPELRRQEYRITFNLVGGFKSLQAYAQTLGMVYADEICYIFESADSPLLRIPRLPVRFDDEPLKRHAAVITRMASAGENVRVSDIPDMPEAYLEIVDSMATLSVWGKLAWLQAKRAVLGGELMAQPGLVFESDFKRDYTNRQDPDDRVALQESLSQAAYCWGAGGLAALRAHTGLLYETYAGKNSIGHFRVNQGFRVSCTVNDGKLRLRHYGPHDYVNQNP